MGGRNLETCFSPALFEADEHRESIVVIIDVLRASSAIITAFANGASEIIPVAEAEVAREYKTRGYLVAAERDGFVLDFADFGNSPFNFTKEKVEGRTIVYSTTNGTGYHSPGFPVPAYSHRIIPEHNCDFGMVVASGEGCPFVLCRMEKQI